MFRLWHRFLDGELTRRSAQSGEAAARATRGGRPHVSPSEARQPHPCAPRRRPRPRRAAAWSWRRCTGGVLAGGRDVRAEVDDEGFVGFVAKIDDADPASMELQDVWL